jgi:UDP-glucose 4-epimerase
VRVLVTGGTGFIGSHACVELLNAGHAVVIADNLCNSKRSVLEGIRAITGAEAEFACLDLRDAGALDALFGRCRFDAVLHFAGLKAVGESVADPLRYYDNNVHGSQRLFQAMKAHGVKVLVFSSSATVYGEPQSLPIAEDAPLAPANPYGRCKLFVEEMLRDLAASDPGWRIALLRYFNPVGAHESGLIGEEPNGTPNNLMPYIAQVAAGEREFLRVFGGDYPTPDGTGVRDYIHVVDLVQGHVQAMEKLLQGPGVFACNLGTGRGHSVLEVIRAFEAASGRRIPYRVTSRRPGDAAASYADPSRARRELGWSARRDLNAMCRDAWRWQCATRGRN